MDIAWFRDLIIIVMGIAGILFFVIMGALAFAVYRRIKTVGESVKGITDSAQEVVESVRAAADNIASVSSFARMEMAEPLIKTAGLVQGMLKGLNAVLGFFGKRKGGTQYE